MNHPHHRSILSLAAMTAILGACSGEQQVDPDKAPDLHRVERGDLRITVREDGEIQASEETRIRCEMEGRVQIIYLIPEGTEVKKGDELVKLDSSSVVDRRATQAITVAKAGAAHTAAKENFDILQKELEATQNVAESKVKITTMDLEKFLGRQRSDSEPTPVNATKDDGTNAEMLRKLKQLVAGDPVLGPSYAGMSDKVMELLATDPNEEPSGALHRDMGEMANKVLQQVDAIRLAQADLKIKEETKRYSEELAKKEFITKNQLDSDILNYESQKSRVTLAWNDLDLLINYTLVKDKLQLQQDLLNASLEREQVKASNRARAIKESADLDSAKAELDLAEAQLANLEKQIKNAVIYADSPGIVVYAKVGDGRRSEPITPESEVRERQDILILPNTTKMVANLKVQEADINKVMRGQPALVTTDQGASFAATVTRVAPLPDSGSRWSNNDRKVYKTKVEIDGGNPNGMLRPNMSCRVEIVISEELNVLLAPLPAVQRQGSVHYVWKRTPDGPTAQRVKIGPSGESSVVILDGLAEGDVIYKSPPPGTEEPDYEQPESTVKPNTELKPKADEGEDRKTVEATASKPLSRTEARKIMDEAKAFVIKKFPEHAEALQGEDRRKSFGIFRDEKVVEALESDAELGPKWARYQAYMADMMKRFGQGSGRPGGGRPGGGRPGGGRPN